MREEAMNSCIVLGLYDRDDLRSRRVAGREDERLFEENEGKLKLQTSKMVKRRAPGSKVSIRMATDEKKVRRRDGGSAPPHICLPEDQSSARSEWNDVDVVNVSPSHMPLRCLASLTICSVP